MIKTVNKEYQEKNKRFTQLKKEMMELITSVHPASLTRTEQDIFAALLEDEEAMEMTEKA